MNRRRQRRPGVKQTAGLIVEGDAEFKALPLLHLDQLVPSCPPLRPINLGGVGSHMAPVGVAKLVKPKVRQHQIAGRSPIVICIDRESRADAAVAFGGAVFRELCSLLRKESQTSAGIHVVVADRAFEAWILADARGLHRRQHFIKRPNFVCFEGQPGKSKQKGVLEIEELLGREYVKTVDGPRLFRQIGFDDARKHGSGAHGSRSLDQFLRAIGV